MLPCIQWLHKMHWLCEQDKHTHAHSRTIFTHAKRTCRRNNADVEGGCSTCAVMADDLKRTQSINPPLLFVQICVPEWIVRVSAHPAAARLPPPTHTRLLQVLDLGLNRICMWPQPSHTFTIALAKLKTNKKGVKLLKRIDTLLQNIHY